MAFKIIDGQLTNRHHHRWPRKHYTRRPPPGIDVRISRRFRNLPCESVQLEIRKHIRLHQTIDPPPMPAQAEMEAHIAAHDRKQCSCYVEQPAPIVVVSKKPKKRRKKTTRRSNGFVNNPSFAGASGRR